MFIRGHNRWIRLLAQAWLLLIVVGSLQPVRPGPVLAMHREIHFVAFGGAALLLLLLSSTRYRQIQAFAALCLLGLSLEYAQHLIYLKPMEWWDVRDDTLAIMAALALYSCSFVFIRGHSTRSL